MSTLGIEQWSIVGNSKKINELFSLIEKVAATDTSVLIEGETGVGKELVARGIHGRSRRGGRSFSILDCGAVADDLVESTLFGHVRGAFTGAVADRVGVFGAADRGTLFLDEIGELPLHLQPALLRAVETGMICPLGQSRYREVDVRVIAATNRDLSDLVGEQGFRSDLFYRLAIVRIRVPPLRERREDIPDLARHFLDRTGRPELEVDVRDFERLAPYSWPGNVRELRNAVQRAAALQDRQLNLYEHVMIGAQPSAAPAGAAPPSANRIDITKPFRQAKAQIVEAFEHEYVRTLLREHRSVTSAAYAAGMDRKHLRTLLRRCGILPSSGARRRARGG